MADVGCGAPILAGNTLMLSVTFACCDVASAGLRAFRSSMMWLTSAYVEGTP